jgi:hypothetical protein
MELPTFSIVISTYNRKNDLIECLKGIFSLEYLQDKLQIIVVDDASKDGTGAVVAEEFPDVLLVENEKNMGAAFSRNKGIKAATKEYVAFIDSDAIPDKLWLQALARNLDEHTLCVGKVVNYFTGKIESGARCSTFLGGSIPCSEKKANVGITCNMAAPRRLLLSIGGFDEKLSVYFEDSDLCIRARKAGYHVKYVPDAVVLHKNTSKKTGERMYLHTANRTYAMMRTYCDSRPKLYTFITLNILYTLFQCSRHLAVGDIKTAKSIIEGVVKAHKRFQQIEQ